MPYISQRRRPNPANQIRGKINRAQGGYFEGLIEQSCRIYSMEGKAEIKKVPEPFHIIQNIGNGRFIGNFSRKAQADFAGTLRGGRSVKFDAKHTQKDRISQNEVTEEQKKDLDAHQKLGAVCFILVSIRMQEFFRVPWDVWKAIAQRYGRKYITAEELQQYQVAFDGSVKFLGSYINKTESGKKEKP